MVYVSSCFGTVPTRKGPHCTKERMSFSHKLSTWYAFQLRRKHAGEYRTVLNLSLLPAVLEDSTPYHTLISAKKGTWCGTRHKISRQFCHFTACLRFASVRSVWTLWKSDIRVQASLNLQDRKSIAYHLRKEKMNAVLHRKSWRSFIFELQFLMGSCCLVLLRQLLRCQTYPSRILY